MYQHDCDSGWLLGSDPEIQVATVVSNHLTAGIMKYFGDAFRYQHAANLFEKLVDQEPQVASLLARSYFGMSECFFHYCRDVNKKTMIDIVLPSIRRGSESYSDP